MDVEALSNVAWAVLAVTGLAGGMFLRRCPWKNAPLLRHLVLLAVMAFLLFPVVSISNHIGYFNYCFSPGQGPDSIFWVSGARREKQFPTLALQALIFLIAATFATLYQRTAFERAGQARLARAVSRSTAATCLRAPPSQFF